MSHDVPIRDLVELATLAPSVHNTQPWWWCADGDRVSLFADHSRQLLATDPDGRDLVLSCGAALHHLRVAAAAAGWRAEVRRLPNPTNDGQLATVSFHAAPATSTNLTLAAALRNRRTDRRHPSPWPVARHRLDRLLALGPPAGVTVVAVVSHRARGELVRLLEEADRAQRTDPRYVDEIVRWTARTDDEGIPATSLLRRASVPGEETSSRFPSGVLPDHAREAEPAAPALLVVCTSSDDTASRLRAGEALSSLLLAGTAEGLQMVPLSQAVEVDATRRLLQDELLHDAACPQIVVRVGLPAAPGPPLPPTHRRPVDEVLGEAASLPPWLGPYVAAP